MIKGRLCAALEAKVHYHLTVDEFLEAFTALPKETFQT